MTVPSESARARVAAFGSRTALIGGWVLAGVMTAAASARVFRSETQPWLIGIQGTIEVLLLPACPIAAVALWRRHRSLGLLASALRLAQAAWTVSAVGWHGNRPAPAGTVQRRLITANVLLDNPRTAALGADLATSGADALVLQEITPKNVDTTSRSAVWAVYPHRELDPQPGFDGSAIVSRYPLRAGGVLDVRATR